MKAERGIEEEEPTYIGSMVTDDVSDLEFDAEVTLEEGVVEEKHSYAAMSNSEEHNRVMEFWEVYVDEGRPEQLSLISWRCEGKDFLLCLSGTSRERITEWRSARRFEEKQPHHIMMAPECRLWSPHAEHELPYPRKEATFGGSEVA